MIATYINSCILNKEYKEREMQESLSPFGKTLPRSAARLLNETNTREQIVAKVWEKWNTAGKTGAQPVCAILVKKPHQTTYSSDEVAIAAATIQWLGTHCGAGFLRDIFLEAEKSEAPFYELTS